MSSKLIFIISSYTVSKLVRFFETVYMDRVFQTVDCYVTSCIGQPSDLY